MFLPQTLEFAHAPIHQQQKLRPLHVTSTARHEDSRVQVLPPLELLDIYDHFNLGIICQPKMPT